MILTAVMLVIQLLPGILQGVGVISPSMSKLITQLGAAVPGLITSVAQGKSVPDDTLAVLSALRAELTALSQNTTLAPQALGQITTLTLSLNNALIGYEAAEKVDDPSTLTDLPTDLETIQAKAQAAADAQAKEIADATAARAKAQAVVDASVAQHNAAAAANQPGSSTAEEPAKEPPAV